MSAQRNRRRSDVPAGFIEQPAPPLARRSPRAAAAFAEVASRSAHRLGLVRLRGSSPRQILVQRVDKFELVRDRQLDVDALDAVASIRPGGQRNHDVFVDLEGVGVPGDRGGARAIQPEFLARLGADGDEALAARARWPGAPPRRRPRDGVLVVADDVADQHHLRQPCRASPWWRSRRRARSARRDVRGRRAARLRRGPGRSR